MKVIAKIAKWITSLNNFIGRFTSWLIVPMTVFLLIDVVMRYIIGHATAWTSELATFLFAAYSVLAGGYLMAERGHVNVDIFYGSLTRKRKAIVDLSTSFLFLLFVTLLIWQSADMAWESYSMWETSHSLWNPIIWPLKLLIPFAAVLVFLQGLVRLLSDVRVLMGFENDPAVWGRQASDESSN